MGDHHVRERAVVQVVGGRIRVASSADTAECATGALLTFAPGERHSVQALEDAMLVLLLAPWPAARHYGDDTEAARAQELPANASTDAA
jgi:quercetin dioxygenase-like cupin family protein